MDVPYNLELDGRKYVEWTWSLLDDGIDIDGQASFSTLRTPDAQPLLEADTAEYLDEQMVIAKKAAVANGHDIADVILCCRAPDIDSDAVADELAKQFFLDTPFAMARATALGEICDIAEDLKHQRAAPQDEPRHRRVAAQAAAGGAQRTCRCSVGAGQRRMQS